MTKIAVLPNVQNTPAVVLQRVREQLPVKAIFIVYEDMDGHWMATHTECSAADLCLAGAYLTRKAMDAAMGTGG